MPALRRDGSKRPSLSRKRSMWKRLKKASSAMPRRRPAKAKRRAMRVKKKLSEEEPILEFLGEGSHLTESGQDGGESIPVRTCIVERARKERPFLLRFVLSPQDCVVPDIKGNLPGRGVWVTAKKEAVAEAVKRRAFQRAFRKPVSAAEDLPHQVEELFKRSALERLSICNKAGLVVVGFAKVEEALNRGGIAGLLHAS